MKPSPSRTELCLVPLRDLVVFPDTVVPFLVGRKKSIRAVEEAMRRGKRLFLATQRQVGDEDPKQEDLYPVGTIARILQMLRLPDGTLRLLVEGDSRANIVRCLDSPEVPKVQVKTIRASAGADPETVALMRAVLGEFQHYSELYKKVPEDAVREIEKEQDPERLVNLVGSSLPLKIESKIELLAQTDLRKRLESLADVLATEAQSLEIGHKIASRVRHRLEKTQKEYFLQEQLKEIHRELGTESNDPNGAKELEEKLKAKGLPEEVRERCQKELGRLARMQPISPEAAVLRTYLEWIQDLPWVERSEENHDIEQARRVLDEDHYNLKKAKERVLDFIAVRLLKPSRVKGPILCFVGPPGTGKTSLGRSVARALGRGFVRVSLGGVRDEAEIRGHRKTYVGALPGKILQSMRKAGSRNPVFLLDEVDKMGADFRGDPASALLEVLDPEQNSTFMDHYLEVQYDLSDVMFITTANSVHGIPYALRDRMEIIPISGYSEHEKIRIAEQFLIPKQLEENGLAGTRVRFQQAALQAIIRGYTMEAGVRSLEREIAAIMRKIARRAVKRGAGVPAPASAEANPGAGGEREPPVESAGPQAKGPERGLVVTPRRVRAYLGKEPYQEKLLGTQGKEGLAYGLAWTELGGTVMPVEVALLEGKGELILTGSLGEVMKESAQTALSFLRANAAALELSPTFAGERDIHIHVPEGAIPKDGPSAGITLTTALLSALRELPVPHGWAMTGEITLTGRLLPVGGIKEKLLAAHRNRIEHVLMPEGNRRDLDELPREVRQGIGFHFAESVLEALQALLPGSREQRTPKGHG